MLRRHGTQLRQGMGVHESIGPANGTSGNAVVLAVAVVLAAIPGLFPPWVVAEQLLFAGLLVGVALSLRAVPLRLAFARPIAP